MKKFKGVLVKKVAKDYEGRRPLDRPIGGSTSPPRLATFKAPPA